MYVEKAAKTTFKQKMPCKTLMKLTTGSLLNMEKTRFLKRLKDLWDQTFVTF